MQTKYEPSRQVGAAVSENRLAVDRRPSENRKATIAAMSSGTKRYSLPAVPSRRPPQSIPYLSVSSVRYLSQYLLMSILLV